MSLNIYDAANSQLNKVSISGGGGSDVSVVSLSANENGTYTAPSGTAYSPVVVDTGVYTGTATPASTLGKDGDYYYKITDLKANISFNLDIKQNSGTYRLGHAFYADEPIMIYGFSGYCRHANDNIKFLLLDDQANIIYESTTTTSVADEWNNLVIDTPISIEANKIYWVMMDMPSAYGCYVGYHISNVWSNFNNIHIEKGVYYQSNSYTYDNSNIYMATVLVKKSYYNVSNEYVKNNNAWILLSSTDKITTTTLSVTENGTYNAPTGIAYSSVSVNVSPEIITRSDWNALTTAQKQAMGLCCIQDTNSGFKLGEYVNGAEYKDIGTYIPYSDKLSIICEAYVDNFLSGGNSWGEGANPLIYANSIRPSYNSLENAVFVDDTTGVIPYCDLQSTGKNFTVYAVMKAASTGQYKRFISNAYSQGQHRSAVICQDTQGTEIMVSTFADDTSTNISVLSGYAVMSMRVDVSSEIHKVKFFINDYSLEKTIEPTASGQYITIGRFTPMGTSNEYPGSNYVRYFAVVEDLDSDAVIQANMKNLYNEFIAE